jgi:hypothetical protein
VTARGITDAHQLRGRAGRFGAWDQAVLTVAGAGSSRLYKSPAPTLLSAAGGPDVVG